jgi:hypothetical protein
MIIKDILREINSYIELLYQIKFVQLLNSENLIKINENVIVQID